MSNTTRTELTASTITTAAITRLRTEAAAAGDAAQIIVCDVALADFDGLDAYAIDADQHAACARAAGMTPRAAQAECARVVNAARAQEV